MEVSRGTEPRVLRLADQPEAGEVDAIELLRRLEAQIEENGRLLAKLSALERVAREERESRRRIADTLRSERRAAQALHERTIRAEAQSAARAEEIERLSQALALAERQTEALFDQLAVTSQPQPLERPSLWRRVLLRPPVA